MPKLSKSIDTYLIEDTTPFQVMSALIILVTMAISNEPLLPTTSQNMVLCFITSSYPLYLLAYCHLAVHDSWALVKAEVINTSSQYIHTYHTLAL